MGKFVIVLVAVVATCSLVNGSKGNKCMKPWGKMNFDHEKFAGEWYCVGKLDSDAVPKVHSTCAKVSVTSKKEGNVTMMDISNSMKMDDGNEIKMIGKARSSCSKSSSVMLAVWKKDGDEKWNNVITQSVLATDYTDFAIVYACRQVYIEESDHFDKFSMLHIFSRKPEMDATLMTVIKNILGGFDFDASEMIMVDNSKC